MRSLNVKIDKDKYDEFLLYVKQLKSFKFIANTVEHSKYYLVCYECNVQEETLLNIFLTKKGIYF